MEENKNKFLEKVKKDFLRNLREEVNADSTFGTLTADENLHQFVFKAKASLEQICHIKPDKPLFAPGTFLTSPDGVGDDDLNYNLGIGQAQSSDSESNCVDIGIIKDIDELGEIRRFLVPETIMVVNETIQIRKTISIDTNDGNQKSFFRQNCFYKISHLLHCLDDKRQIFVPTKMFKETNSTYISDLIVNQLDMSIIFHIYNTSCRDDIIKPLVIHKT